MTQFKTYRTRPVTVEAVEITEDDKIFFGWGYTLIREGCEELDFAAHKKPKAGDFIIQQSEDDIYLCPREVFLEKYYEIVEFELVEKGVVKG